MLRFANDGSAVAWSSGKTGRRIRQPLPGGHLDLRRTWALVAELLSEAGVEVQWIFIHQPLAELLLQEAVQERADPALVGAGTRGLAPTTDAPPHDDHMHVRVFCPVQSRGFGCVDKGPRRWWKKRWKYMSPSHRTSNHGGDDGRVGRACASGPQVHQYIPVRRRARRSRGVGGPSLVGPPCQRPGEGAAKPRGQVAGWAGPSARRTLSAGC